VCLWRTFAGEQKGRRIKTKWWTDNAQSPFEEQALKKESDDEKNCFSENLCKKQASDEDTGSLVTRVVCPASCWVK
jgi:hypothetical protein